LSPCSRPHTGRQAGTHPTFPPRQAVTAPPGLSPGVYKIPPVPVSFFHYPLLSSSLFPPTRLDKRGGDGRAGAAPVRTSLPAPRRRPRLKGAGGCRGSRWLRAPGRAWPRRVRAGADVPRGRRVRLRRRPAAQRAHLQRRR
jgi:hypothetical protein